jgi:hypothetical protein
LANQHRRQVFAVSKTSHSDRQQWSWAEMAGFESTADILRECAPIANGIDLSLLAARQPYRAG